MNKIVVAMDSFKGSLSAIEATEAVAQAISDTLPHCEVDMIPLSDGGDGLTSVLVRQLGGTIRHIDTFDALMRPISAGIGEADGCAIIEMAEAAGISLLAESERNPMKATTYGVGLMIQAALDSGYKKLLIGLGGSATNDAGLGALQAIGLRCFDAQESPIKTPITGATLIKINHIDTSTMADKLKGVNIKVVCDVNNPFSGTSGAAYIYAPQKGATADDVIRLDAGLKAVAKAIKNAVNVDVEQIQGAGAAGGMGGSLVALAGATMVRGIDAVLDMVHFDRRIADADLIITGEGSLDSQSLMGKAVMGVADRAQRAGVPALVVAGRVESRDIINKLNLTDALAVTPTGVKPEIYMQQAIACDFIRRAVKKWLENRQRT